MDFQSFSFFLLSNFSSLLTKLPCSNNLLLKVLLEGDLSLVPLPGDVLHLPVYDLLSDLLLVEPLLGDLLLEILGPGDLLLEILSPESPLDLPLLGEPLLGEPLLASPLLGEPLPGEPRLLSLP